MPSRADVKICVAGSSPVLSTKPVFNNQRVFMTMFVNWLSTISKRMAHSTKCGSGWPPERESSELCAPLNYFLTRRRKDGENSILALGYSPVISITGVFYFSKRLRYFNLAPNPCNSCARFSTPYHLFKPHKIINRSATPKILRAKSLIL